MDWLNTLTTDQLTTLVEELIGYFTQQATTWRHQRPHQLMICWWDDDQSRYRDDGGSFTAGQIADGLWEYLHA